jgi:hypothetical protein
MGFTKPNRSPGLLVSSYLTVSPLPLTKAGGGLFSVALSLAFRPVGVTHHHTLRSPDFPPAALELAQNMLCIPENSRRSPGPLRFLRKSLHAHARLASLQQIRPQKRLFAQDTC